MIDDSACAAILNLIENNVSLKSRQGSIRGAAGQSLPALRGEAGSPLPMMRALEDSELSLHYGEKLQLKVYRRQRPGRHPESELGRCLTEAHFEGIRPFAGTLEYCAGEGLPSTIAVLEGVVASEGDGWTLTTDELGRYYENCAPLAIPAELQSNGAASDLVKLSADHPGKLARDHLGIALDSAARIGKRTAELHLALAAASGNPALAPEPLGGDDLQRTLNDFRKRAAIVFDNLRDSVARLPDEVLDLAGLVLARRRQILDSFRGASGDRPPGQKIRIHGHYDLSKVLRVRTEYLIVNFEGRCKDSPLRDVAGMLRSLSYAAYASLIGYTARRHEDFQRLEPWARLWERSTSAEFLRAYRNTAVAAAFLPSDEADLRRLLAAYWLDKALDELAFELKRRPVWARIPLLGILSIPVETGGLEWNSMPLPSQL
jgi:maltose alpha-D-glucosyltransferase/alpha-amylase